MQLFVKERLFTEDGRSSVIFYSLTQIGKNFLARARRVHNYVCRTILGKSYDEVNSAIDGPYKFLGKSHRVLFHDPISAVVVGFTNSKGFNGSLAGLLHVGVDWLCSQNKDIKKVLEVLPSLDVAIHVSGEIISRLIEQGGQRQK